jgi:predicted nucleotidyltransferase
VSNVFHEYFGHGVFCENSIIGKKLVEITRNNEDTKSYLYSQIDKKVQPFGIYNQNIANYEGFAVWLEEKLCDVTGNSHEWKKRESTLPKDYVDLSEYFKTTENKLTSFGLMSQMGFPKYYDSEKLVNTIRKIYGLDFSKIDFIVLYGSKKPQSDIDLFIVSENGSRNYFNGWLDIYELNREEFNLLSRNLDISATDPLFSGELQYGDLNHFETIRKSVLNSKVTEEAITHNISQMERLKSVLSKYEENSREQLSCLSYIESYYRTVDYLKRGEKLLTLRS